MAEKFIQITKENGSLTLINVSQIATIEQKFNANSGKFYSLIKMADGIGDIVAAEDFETLSNKVSQGVQ